MPKTCLRLKTVHGIKSRQAINGGIYVFKKSKNE
jgi:hypothetical protein|nr:MAG TPA: hypothetical protein [Caudoviricetes sp.]DAP54445.1 MAG TPA: hypothetical protein [Caudoviricetes sp.]